MNTKSMGAGLAWVPNGAARLLVLLLTTNLAAGTAQLVRAQQAPVPRVWAAQTGWNQVTLSWEEIPGAVEHRIYAGDPDAASAPTAPRPISTLSATRRDAIIIGINRVANGLYLEAVGANRRRLRKLAFNPVTPVTTAQVISAPADATATVTGPTEITLSWTAVPGATAYAIGRAVRPEGFRMLCRLCSTDPTYVDRAVTPGAAHSYVVAAVFPGGLSRRTTSNIVTPGAAATVAAGGTSGTPSPTVPTSTPQTTTSYPPPGQPAGTTSPYTPPGTSTPPTTATPPSATPGSTTQTTTTTPSPTTGSVVQTTSLLGVLQLQVDSLGSWLAFHGTRLTGGFAADSAKVSQVLQQLDSLRLQAMGTAGNALMTATLADSTALQQVLGNFMQRLSATRSSVMNTLANMLAAQTTTTTHSSSAVWTGPCRLDYQRADNMWAPSGSPVGTLGTETISLLDGQAKLFFTDWKYEKLRNDGSNYYGSHLRIATNPGTRPVKLQVQTQLLSTWVTLNAGETKQVQVDLAQVSCTN